MEENMTTEQKNKIRHEASEMALKASETLETLEMFIEKYFEDCFCVPVENTNDDDCIYVDEIDSDSDKYGRFAKQLSKKCKRK